MRFIHQEHLLNNVLIGSIVRNEFSAKIRVLKADDVITMLHLQPHPRERGYYVETYRSSESIGQAEIPLRYQGSRSFSTAIYFLLKAGGFSEIHRLQSDEIFHFYLGSTVELLALDSNGKGRLIRLGNNINNGEVPQHVIPRGCWQGMRCTGDFALLGCTVAPGFEYTDYESAERQALINVYPDWTDWIRRLTHDR